ncbi:MAG: alpha/beta hydrolase [Telluria sp.]
MQQSDSAAQVRTARRKQVYVVHGYTASPADHWFPWLEARVASEGVDVDVLAMPDSDRPVAAAWDAFLDARAVRRGEDTFFVAHSLGCIAVVRHLLRTQRADRASCGGVVLVAGFAEPVPGLPELDGFVDGVGSLEQLRETVRHRSVIASRDDEAVPHAVTHRLAERLDAEFLTVEQGGHFLGCEGFTEFPLVYAQLSAMLRAA